MSPTDNMPTKKKKKKKRGNKKKVDHSQYKKGKEISSLPSASRDDSISTSKENFDDSVSTLSYQVKSTLTLTSTSTLGPGADEKRNEDEIKEEGDDEEGKIFKSDKQIYYRVAEKVDSNTNTNNYRNSVRKKRKKRKDKVEWEASVAGDTSSTTKINASCTDSADDQQNDCQDYSIRASAQSITISIISDASTRSYNRSNSDFNFRVLKEQRNSYIHRLLKKDGSNNGSSFQSSSSDEESDFSSVINSNNNETSFNKPISRSELREDLTAQVRARFIQDERVAEDVRASIRRAISKSGGLGIVDEEKGDDGGNDDNDDDNDDDDDGEGGDDKNTDKNNKDEDEESGNENNDNKEDGDETVKTRRLKRLIDIIISRRGYIVFVAICVCLLVIGNILLIVLWARKKN
jgi:hypothetical protein